MNFLPGACYPFLTLEDSSFSVIEIIGHWESQDRCLYIDFLLSLFCIFLKQPVCGGFRATTGDQALALARRLYRFDHVNPYM